VTLAGTDRHRAAAFQECGVELIEVNPDPDGNVDLAAALRELGRRGLTRVLVEGGATLAAVLLRQRLADRIAWFRSPSIMGGDGLPAALPFGVDLLQDMPRFHRLSIETIGEDVLETLAASA
jgi:diaminohydroxyphosphoribosylaminopyrimidine deaminase/5-amino-6-(5-phosphoribosylamino)uracil reductase